MLTSAVNGIEVVAFVVRAYNEGISINIVEYNNYVCQCGSQY